VSESYCRSCYRPIAAEDVVCAACAHAAKPRWALALGVAAVPFLVMGVLMLNARLCLIGAAIAAVATLVHVALALR
jgi:hypothetical protein